MKKFMTLFTILFVFTLGMFAQKVAITTPFILKIDGTYDVTNDTLFDVTYNTTNSNPNVGGFIIVNFYDIFDNVIFDGIGSAFVTHNETYSYADIDNSKGCYMVKIDYTWSSTNPIVIKVNTTTYEAPKYTVSDTVNIYTNGYDDGYTVGESDGVLSVVCDFTQDDLDNSYNDGLDNGVDLTVDENTYQVGFEAGKQSCGTNGVALTSIGMGVSVYPTLIDSGDNVTVDCPNFKKIDIFSITGILKGSFSTPDDVSTDNLETGVYFFNVHDLNGNASTVKVLVR